MLVTFSKLFQKTWNKHCFSFAKNSVLSRYSPLLDNYWRVAYSQSDCISICNSIYIYIYSLCHSPDSTTVWNVLSFRTRNTPAKRTQVWIYITSLDSHRWEKLQIPDVHVVPWLRLLSQFDFSMETAKMKNGLKFKTRDRNGNDNVAVLHTTSPWEHFNVFETT